MFAQPKKNRFVSVSEIESKIDDFQLLQYYFGINKTGLYKSPFRSDSKPSFGIYQQYGRIKFKDFATGEFGGIYELIGLKENLSFNEVLQKIVNDFALKTDGIVVTSNPKPKKNEIYCKKEEKTKNISIRVRDWNKEDISYWKSYGIDINTAKRFNVYPIDYYWINNFSFRADKLAYAYLVWDGDRPTYKIYQPKAEKGIKWINNYKKDTVSLLDETDTGTENIVICSSVKDALCLICNFGIDCICPQSENFDINIPYLKERFPKAKFYVLFDNDDPGLVCAEALSIRYGLDNIVLPKFNGGKDVSDMFLCYGKEKFIETLTPIMKFIKSELEF